MSYLFVWETVIYLLQVLAQLNFNPIVWFNSQLLELVIFNPDSFIFHVDFWFWWASWWWWAEVRRVGGVLWWLMCRQWLLVIESPTLQPGLAVPHSKVWCQIGVKSRPERKFNQEFLFSQKIDRLTDWLKCCNLWEWRDRTEEFSGQALVPDKVFFQTLRTSEAAFDACNMNTCCLDEILYNILCLTWYLCWWFQVLMPRSWYLGCSQ